MGMKKQIWKALTMDTNVWRDIGFRKRFNGKFVDENSLTAWTIFSMCVMAFVVYFACYGSLGAAGSMVASVAASLALLVLALLVVGIMSLLDSEEISYPVFEMAESMRDHPEEWEIETLEKRYYGVVRHIKTGVEVYWRIHDWGSVTEYKRNGKIWVENGYLDAYDGHGNDAYERYEVIFLLQQAYYYLQLNEVNSTLHPKYEAREELNKQWTAGE